MVTKYPTFKTLHSIHKIGSVFFSSSVCSIVEINNQRKNMRWKKNAFCERRQKSKKIYYTLTERIKNENSVVKQFFFFQIFFFFFCAIVAYKKKKAHE